MHRLAPPSCRPYQLLEINGDDNHISTESRKNRKNMFTKNTHTNMNLLGYQNPQHLSDTIYCLIRSIGNFDQWPLQRHRQNDS